MGRGYVLMYGRLDDDPSQFVDDSNDPRAPAEKLRIFWRFIGEMAYNEREEGEDDWMGAILRKAWKDTPTKWPKAVELSKMNDASQQEWKERRMVYNRRKEKILIAVQMHEAYLAIPNRL